MHVRYRIANFFFVNQVINREDPTIKSHPCHSGQGVASGNAGDGDIAPFADCGIDRVTDNGSWNCDGRGKGRGGEEKGGEGGRKEREGGREGGSEREGKDSVYTYVCLLAFGLSVVFQAFVRNVLFLQTIMLVLLSIIW